MTLFNPSARVGECMLGMRGPDATAIHHPLAQRYPDVPPAYSHNATESTDSSNKKKVTRQ